MTVTYTYEYEYITCDGKKWRVERKVPIVHHQQLLTQLNYVGSVSNNLGEAQCPTNLQS